MQIARRTLFQGVCATLLGRVLPEPIAEHAAAKAELVRRHAAWAINDLILVLQEAGLIATDDDAARHASLFGSYDGSAR